jgi:hypothetical protein
MTHKILNVLFTLALVLSFGLATAAPASALSFTATELLGRPTDHSVTVNVVADTALEVYFEYGTTSGDYTGQTDTATFAANTPIEMVIDGLTSNTQYFYRMVYSTNGGSTWTERDEHSFWTQRAQGSTFTFTITSDSHVNIMLGSKAEWTKTLNNVALDHPDFHLDLGDTFAMDSVGVGDVAGAESAYLFQRPLFGIISHSAPIFLVDGNHEQTEGWHLLGTLANSLPVIGTNAMKKYFLNPVPDDFYSGNTDTYSYLDGDQLREDYYAWTWGDALFVVLDPFWYTTTKPYIGNTGGGEGDTTGSGDRWDWTLGLEQFNWFKETLENSDAKYKFIFAHQMVGGSEDYGHGGANSINLVEMGGYNEAGTMYEWDTKRPVANWGFEPVHQLMVANGVSAFFHGHDHQYAYEKRDGIVYQEVPAAGFTGNGFGLYTTGNGCTIKALPNDGHLRVTVSPSQATVDYIATSNRAVNYSYTILPNQTPEPGILGDVNGDELVNSTDALIILSCDVGIDTSQFCPMNCGDVNGDGLVNSTDALIILSYDVDMVVPYPVGESGCPSSVTPCSGCSP